MKHVNPVAEAEVSIEVPDRTRKWSVAALLTPSGEAVRFGIVSGWNSMSCVLDAPQLRDLITGLLELERHTKELAASKAAIAKRGQK